MHDTKNKNLHIKTVCTHFSPHPTQKTRDNKTHQKYKNKRLGTIKINESQIIYLQIVRTVCRACCQMIVALEEYHTREEDRISEMQLTLNLIDKHRGL